MFRKITADKVGKKMEENFKRRGYTEMTRSVIQVRSIRYIKRLVDEDPGNRLIKKRVAN